MVIVLNWFLRRHCHICIFCEPQCPTVNTRRCWSPGFEWSSVDIVCKWPRLIFDWHSKMDPSDRPSMEAACSFVCVTTPWMRWKNKNMCNCSVWFLLSSHPLFSSLLSELSPQIFYLSFVWCWSPCVCALKAAGGISLQHFFFKAQGSYRLLGVTVIISSCSPAAYTRILLDLFSLDY